MKINDIFTQDKLKEYAEFANQNGYIILDVEKNENGERQFKITEIPKPTENETLQILRSKRKDECFPIINRGVLWYNTLTTEQQQELDIWYKAWLNVPQIYQETKPNNIETIIPTKPSWLK